MKKEITRLSKRCIPGVTLHQRDGYYQIRHIGLTARRVKTDPAFHNTRREARKFAHIVKIAKTINDAIFRNAGIKKTLPRLITLVNKVLKTGTENHLNINNPAEADWTLLENFEGDPANPWASAISTTPAVHVTPDQQQVVVTFPSMIPAAVLRPPPGIAHARIYTLYVCVDMVNGACTTQKARTTIIPCCNNTIQLKPLITTLESETHKLHLLAMGVEWYSRNNPDGTLQQTRQPGQRRITLANLNIGSVKKQLNSDWQKNP